MAFASINWDSDERQHWVLEESLDVNYLSVRSDIGRNVVVGSDFHRSAVVA